MGGRHRVGDAPLVPLGTTPVRAPWQADRMGLTRAWGTRTDVQRADFATRAQLFAASASEPLVVRLAATSSPHYRVSALVPSLALAALHAALCLALLRGGLDRLRNGTPVPPTLAVAVAAIAGVGV